GYASNRVDESAGHGLPERQPFQIICWQDGDMGQGAFLENPQQLLLSGARVLLRFPADLWNQLIICGGGAAENPGSLNFSIKRRNSNQSSTTSGSSIIPIPLQSAAVAVMCPCVLRTRGSQRHHGWAPIWHLSQYRSAGSIRPKGHSYWGAVARRDV